MNPSPGSVIVAFCTIWIKSTIHILNIYQYSTNININFQLGRYLNNWGELSTISNTFIICKLFMYNDQTMDSKINTTTTSILALSNFINIRTHIVRLPEFHKFLNNQWIYLIHVIWLRLSNFKNIQYQNSIDNF